MTNLLIGLIALALGLLLCFRGAIMARILLAIWGALAGFWFGAAIAAGLTGEPFLGDAWGWIMAIATAVILALLAYWFYVLAVVIWLGSLGFGLGVALANALGAADTTVSTIVGLVVAVLLVVLALALRLPAALLVVLTALTGASLTLGGVLILLGEAPAGPELEQIAWPDQWWWTVVYVVLVVLGILAQARRPEIRRARSYWRRPRARA